MEDRPVQQGMTRRTALRRGAVVGGTLVWAAPAVQTLATPAWAQASAQCTFTVKLATKQGVCISQTFADDSDCCECIEKYEHMGKLLAVLKCVLVGKCSTKNPVAPPAWC